MVVDLNEQIKGNTIQFRREYGIKLPDCIVAATAAYLGMPLFSADKGFLCVEEIDLLTYEPS